ncbi:DHHA1 domain protein [uncultured archaeon]|nr:DHHA1 domain protein [uncultured archaeon]
MENSLESQIKNISQKFVDLIKESGKEILVVSHFDTDGISSAAILVQTLKRLDKKFSLKILKGLEKNFTKTLPEDRIIFFLDLGSGVLDELGRVFNDNIFVIDHHEVHQKIPKNVLIINTELHENKQKISASGLTYLFCREINEKNKDLAKLSVLGMIGDLLEKEIDKLNHSILEDSEVKRKRGLLVYPATRPLNITLEFSSNPFIPGVTGDQKGVLELLRDAELTTEDGKYKSLLELKEEEMERLVTSISLRNPSMKHEELLGDIFLVKMFNKLEDARELSAKINACSRMGEPEIALQMCLESTKAKKRADAIHIKYKQEILSGMRFVAETQKISGEGFVIINAQDNIKETIVGTIASIISNSSTYSRGTAIFTMAYDQENIQKIKVSARAVGREGKNVRQILSKVIDLTGGEVGGHEFAAGCVISREKENEFIDCLKKNFEIELVKI